MLATYDPDDHVANELPPWADKFFALLAEHGLIHKAARDAGTTAKQVAKYREGNEAFEEYTQQALESSNDILEMEARRRAVDGIEREIYYKGEVVGYEQQYSDTLLVKMLEAKRKQEFATKLNVEHSVAPTVLIRSFDTDPTDPTQIIDAEFTPVPLAKATPPPQYVAVLPSPTPPTMDSSPDDFA